MTSTGNDWMFDLHVSGDMVHGEPQIQVLVDGHQVGGAWYDITAQHSKGQSQDIHIAGLADAGEAHKVEVQFINDARSGTSGTYHSGDVFVSDLTVNGKTIDGSQAISNTATDGKGTTSNPNDAVMDKNGTLTFNVPASMSAPSHAPAPSPAPSPTPAHTPTPSSGSGSSSGSSYSILRRSVPTVTRTVLVNGSACSSHTWANSRSCDSTTPGLAMK